MCLFEVLMPEFITSPATAAAGLGALAAEAQAPPAPVIPSAGPPESDDDDDLMITLDENATSYEPTQNRFQYQRVAPDAGSKPPSQDMDGASAIPGLGFGTRSAIGGIPRSAIPGLGPSFPMNLPVNQPSSQEAKPPPEAHPPGPGGPGAHMRPPPRRQLRMEDAVFPSQWRPGLGIKLPGQTRVSPEEYREFLSLGHGDIFDIDLDSVVDAPWRIPGIDPGDFFNYGMTEQGWKDYLARVYRFRQEFAMKGQIQTIEQARGAGRGRGGPMEGQFFGAPGAPAPGSQFPAAGGGGTDGGADGDQALQSSMAEGRDEHYEAFVTSERPPVSDMDCDVGLACLQLADTCEPDEGGRHVFLSKVFVA